MESLTFVASGSAALLARCIPAKRCRKQNFVPNGLHRHRRAHVQAQLSQNPQEPFKYVLDSAAINILAPNAPSQLPILVYVAGLDSAALPSHQCAALRRHFNIVSVCHSPSDRSNWEELVNAVVPKLEVLASNGRITLLGESFGAALSLRLAAACHDAISRLVLLNPGTALAQDTFLSNATRLLPILGLDPSERFLYKAAAMIMFQALLTKENRLEEESIPDGPHWLRSVDIDRVPLQAMLHRVDLLRRFSDTFTDHCIRDLVQTPTLLLASGQDRLLQSRREIARLAGILPNIEERRILEGSAHAALLEKDVKLSDILLQRKSPSSGALDPTVQSSGENKSTNFRDADYDRAFENGRRFFEPWRHLTAPYVIGKQNVTHGLRVAEEGRRRPMLFVGNHSVFGILDLSVFYIELKEIIKDRRLCSLADPIHFDLFSDISGGRWERFVTDLGAVPATPRNFYRLLSSGENILLFPGGAREVCRRRGENYQLFWKPDVDFLRPAAKFDAIIVPFSAVGADDSVDILVDGQELQQLPHIGDMVKAFLEERELSSANLMPIASFPPKPDRFYFKFHHPIDTCDIDPNDAVTCKKVYYQTKKAVEKGMQDLLARRKTDPDRGLDSRIRRQIFRSSSLDAPGQPSLGFLLNSILPEFEL